MSATENIPETPEGIILESMLEGMNQYYSAELSQKVKRGMRETRIKGNFQGGNILYGYKVEGRKIVIDEDSSEVVKYIFEEFAKGRAVYDIRNTLNSRGITYKGKELAKNTVYGILRNEKYSGKYTVNGEIIDNMYPAIISERTFNQARAIIDANKFGKSSIKVVYLLKNKMRCGYCGEKIVSDGGKSHGGKKYYYYKCKGKKANHNECKLTIFKKETLEELIIDNIIKELSKPETMDFITKKLLDIQEKEIRTNSTLSLLLKEQKQVQSSLDNLVLAVERGIMSNSTNKRLHELEKHLEELERQILIENSKEEIKVGEKEIRAFYQKALSLEPALLINCLIREIVVYDESIQIYYKTPLTISPDESRGFSFSQKIVNLKTYTQTNEKNHTNIQLTMTI
jgi:predicted DNA-binding protein